VELLIVDTGDYVVQPLPLRMKDNSASQS